jgi:transposase, IS6 family
MEVLQRARVRSLINWSYAKESVWTLPGKALRRRDRSLRSLVPPFLSQLFRELEELMTERGLSVDHTTVWRWVQRYAPELSRRVRRELKRTGTSWRVDETYVRVAGRWVYLYRAVDSSGATLDFYLSEKRDAAAAKQFLAKVLAATNRPRPRVINVDGNPSYPNAVNRLKQEGKQAPT